MKVLIPMVICLVLALGLGCDKKSAVEEAGGMPDSHAEVFVKNCAKCHQLNRVEEAHKVKSKSEMIEILGRMQKKPDADISEKDYKELLLKYGYPQSLPRGF
jgi:hypothetical protein